MSSEDYARASVLLSQLSLRELEDLQRDVSSWIESIKIDNSSTLENGKYYCLDNSTDYYYVYSKGTVLISLEDSEYPWIAIEDLVQLGNYTEVINNEVLQKLQNLLREFIRHKQEEGLGVIERWKEELEKLEILQALVS